MELQMYIYLALMRLSMTSDDIQIVKLPLEEPLRGRWRRIALVLGLMVRFSAPGVLLIAQDQRSKAAAGKAFWRVEGRPCAPLDAETFRRRTSRASTTAYDGATYVPHAGGMTCTHRTDEIGGAPVRYPICKFDGPDYLGVTVGGQARF